MSSEGHDSRLRRYLLTGWAGRNFDSIPELGMHVGMWSMIFAVGVLYGHVRPDAWTLAAGAFALGAVLGVAGQLTVDGDADA